MAKTFNQLVSDYKTISRDDSSANETLGKQVAKDEYWRVIQDYADGSNTVNVFYHELA